MGGGNGLFCKIPRSAIGKLERGERPTPAERRQIVRIVVAELLETVPAPQKSQLEPIAKEIVGKYPRSFFDYIGDSVIGGGHSSLLCQLIARVENSRRVDSLMNNTYPLQRLDVNKKLPLALIKENWPFLCVRKYMLLHAEKLVGFPVAEKFEGAVRDRIPEVFYFLRSFATKRLRNVDLELQHQHLNYIPALAAYFEEDCNVIFEVNKSLHEVQNETPVTPFIACIGNRYQLDPVCTVYRLSKQTSLKRELFALFGGASILWLKSTSWNTLLVKRRHCAKSPKQDGKQTCIGHS
ncbi:hypothetical protein AVEN_70730-1 [Araneus ventricosus]|uniref:Uncharacterized protein n=1 Tax=Araneus ventricosus TaxID=182803 RepID=A0A4Y2V2Q0_ARAVE|nr:hypothetical protein AVEN_70730-1 [Araneus ventricosus]